MPNQPLLDNISIILVSTKTPANIGSTARCMMNMGITRLLLVNPPRDANNEASKLAAGADDILKNALTFSSLEEAIAGHGLVIGTSRQEGRRRKNVASPREMAQNAVALLATNCVAIVFGNEVNGLEISDLSLCHELVHIPSSDAFPSLNLSHAVMVVAYELFIAASAPPEPALIDLAPQEDLQNFYRHFQETLENVGFIDNTNADRMMLSLRQIFGRARLDNRDLTIWRGILSLINKPGRGIT